MCLRRVFVVKLSRPCAPFGQSEHVGVLPALPLKLFLSVISSIPVEVWFSRMLME